MIPRLLRDLLVGKKTGTTGGVHPGILYEYQNKGVTKFDGCKCMKRQGPLDAGKAEAKGGERREKPEPENGGLMPEYQIINITKE